MEITSEKKRIAGRLIALSALALFTELVIIRWVPSYILYLGYFSNIILIASFFGLGAGALISQQRFKLLPLFPWLLMILIGIVGLLKFNISINSNDVIYFQNNQNDLRIPLEIVAPITFLLVTFIFLPLGQRLGSLLNQLKPLWAYTWDIVGSLLGIGGFTLLAFLGVSPIYWFFIILLLYLYLIPKRQSYIIGAIGFLPVLIISGVMATDTIWSPYYKITLSPINYQDSNDIGYDLLTNSTGHQTLELPQHKEFIYSQPYELITNPDYENILVIGAGGGTDVAIALEQSRAQIDAVEIDPTILELGRNYHPSQPYAATDRVEQVINDGRAFLETTENKYDLIIYALTDSLVLASSYTNTRLESYLFTLESFEQAKNHLTEDGLVVLYNYYRQPWLIQKLGQMLQTTFIQDPLIITSPQSLAVLMSGPGLNKLKTGVTSNVELGENKFEPATDNWPFLYLKNPGLPAIYVSSLIVIILLVVGFIFLINRKILSRHFHWHFFFLGVGFLLLETKNIINFSLLFGSTWLVNALVFFAILLAVLAANFLTMKFKFKNQKILYVILGLLLILNILIPLKSLLVFGLFGRYILASLLTFSPIVLANLIFASSFRITNNASFSFGANLIGAVIGGFLEYASLITGYHYLLIIIMVFYLLSYFYRNKFQLKQDFNHL